MPPTRTPSSRASGHAIAKAGNQRVSESPSSIKSVTIKGQTLPVTVAFDTFWYYCHERNEIDIKRREGKAWPWSNDIIFQNYPFCNTFRVADRTTQWFIDNVVAKGSKEPIDVLFRAVLFTVFTRIETYQLLEEKLSPLTYENFCAKFDNYIDALDTAKNSGQALYTGSFQKPGPQWSKTTHHDHLELLNTMMRHNKLLNVITNAKYLVEVYEHISSYPSYADFSAYQLLLNLSYTNLMHFSEDDFVVAGLGAKSGIGKIFKVGGLKKARETESNFDAALIRWFAENQDEHFARLGLRFRGLGPDNLPMRLVDVEHSLCELDKYCRIKHPNLKGGSTHIRNKFKRPNTDERVLPATISIPNVWSNSARETSRIREDPIVVDKQYLVEKIINHRHDAGTLKLEVKWVNYDSDWNTWEPEKELRQDCPDMVDDYFKARSLGDK